MRLSSPAKAALTLGLAATLLPLSMFAQNSEGDASGPPASGTVVTVMPKQGEAVLPVPQSALQVKVDGKKVEPLAWQPYGHSKVQLVVLMDGALRTSFGRSLDEMAKFLQNLPPNVAVGIAYMQNGAAVFESPISFDHAKAVGALHLPAGSPGSSANPYFCLQDLANRWPAAPSDDRREVLMITDGVDPYNLRYDPQDPYLQTAVSAANRAKLVVYSIFWHNQGFLSRTGYETNAGQNYLFQVADATGGKVYYQGTMNPVSITPYLADLATQLENQYELSVPVKPEKKVSYAQLRVKTDIGSVKLKAADQIAVPPADAASRP
jgi:hypothetical protein